MDPRRTRAGRHNNKTLNNHTLTLTPCQLNHVLAVDGPGVARARIARILSGEMPETDITSCDTVQEACNCLERSRFDLASNQRSCGMRLSQLLNYARKALYAAKTQVRNTLTE